MLSLNATGRKGALGPYSQIAEILGLWKTEENQASKCLNSNPGGYIKMTSTGGIKFILTSVTEVGCGE
jgi:hypothetical protein